MSILDDIVAFTRERVEREKRETPLEELADRACTLRRSERAAVGESDVSRDFAFERALAAPGLSFICEVKKASPSRGVIVEEYPFLDIARSYEAAGAAALSCLTEPHWFRGDDRHLQEIVREVSIPVLRKDFVVDPYMVYQAKVLGASAVLLICAVLEDDELVECLRLADELGLSVLVEAHDAQEVRRALAVGARVVGVNNRDLKTFTVDVGTSLVLRDLVGSKALFVSESGIHASEQVSRLAQAGVDAVLVGEALMNADDRGSALKSLRGELS